MEPAALANHWIPHTLSSSVEHPASWDTITGGWDTYINLDAIVYIVVVSCLQFELDHCQINNTLPGTSSDWPDSVFKHNIKRSIWPASIQYIHNSCIYTSVVPNTTVTKSFSNVIKLDKYSWLYYYYNILPVTQAICKLWACIVTWSDAQT